jgi:hypothetical protein
MSNVEEYGLDLLDLIEAILSDVEDGTDDLRAAKKAYNRKIKRYTNKLWRKKIAPVLTDLEDDDWIDDALDSIAMLKVLMRRFL